MPEFFDRMPRILYTVTGRKRRRTTQLLTDIFFRVAILDIIKNRFAFYVEYIIGEGETPESIADRLYNDPEAHWIILLTNDIVDAQYDWPLDYHPFNRYIKNKYGSIEAAHNTIHHYFKKTERIIRDAEGREENITTWYSEIDRADPRGNSDPTFAETYPEIPYDSYSGTPASSFEQITAAISGQIIQTTTTTGSVTCYEYEHDLNEKKRTIRLLPVDAYNQIMSEFESIVAQNNPNIRLHLKSARI
jgi:hypothetical protein